MATRSEKLNRLVIGTPCRASRDAMEGTGTERFCRECNKPVYDFGAMTPRQIEARIEASRGRVCARMTRSADGSLVTLPSPLPPSSWLERRASPLVSALVTTFLGLGSAAAESAPPAPPEASAARDRAAEPDRSSPAPTAPGSARMNGIVKDDQGAAVPGFEVTLRNELDGRERAAVSDSDGIFTLESLDSGTYTLEGRQEGFSPISQPNIALHAGRAANVEIQVQPIVEGILTVTDPDALRPLFEESELVVSGVAGASVAIDPDDPSDVATELRVVSVFKGKFAGRRLSIQHSESEGPYGGHLAPGTQILAFLNPGDPLPGRKSPNYISADYGSGLKVLSALELAAYGERIEALARISRRGDPAPARLAEWLVATAAEPLTRREATLEIERALAELNEQGDPATVQSEESPDLVGAFITKADKTRLSRALLSTRGISEGDFALFKIVRPWAGEAASEWLTRQFRETEPLDDGVARDVMARLAEELESETLAHLLEESDAKQDALVADLGSDSSEAEWKRIEALVAAAHKDLRDRFRRMLGG